MLEDLITAFIAIYPDGIEGEPYRGFRDDAIATLGKCLMEPRCWNGSEVAVGEMLHRSCNNPAGIWRWWDASGDFSASMFFCLKYLPEPQVTPWLESVLAIEAPHWRAQVMVWMVGAKEVLEGTVGWPSQFPLSARPSIAWEWSHCLRPVLAARAADGSPRSVNLIPDASRETARRLLATWFDEDRFLDWLTSIASVPYLEAELAEIPSTFESIYVRPNARR